MLRTTVLSYRPQAVVVRLVSASRSSTVSVTQSTTKLRTSSIRSYTTIRASRSSPATATTPRTSTTTFTLPSHALFTARRPPSTIIHRLRSLRFIHNSRARRSGKAPSPDPTPNLGSPASADTPPKSLRDRLKKLSREYGWTAVGVYLALSALDFPFCYLLVRYLGTDRIGEWEHLIVSNIKRVIPTSIQQAWHDWRASFRKTEKHVTGDDKVSEGVEMATWGVEEAEARNKSEASLATQLALAYAIHKSFIFVRIPLTAAVLPKVVKVLRGWGWDIGKRTTKEMRAANRAAMPVKKPRAGFTKRS